MAPFLERLLRLIPILCHLAGAVRAGFFVLPLPRSAGCADACKIDVVMPGKVVKH